jgi:hypothetical protein
LRTNPYTWLRQNIIGTPPTSQPRGETQIIILLIIELLRFRGVHHTFGEVDKMISTAPFGAPHLQQLEKSGEEESEKSFS